MNHENWSRPPRGLPSNFVRSHWRRKMDEKTLKRRLARRKLAKLIKFKPAKTPEKKELAQPCRTSPTFFGFCCGSQRIDRTAQILANRIRCGSSHHHRRCRQRANQSRYGSRYIPGPMEGVSKPMNAMDQRDEKTDRVFTTTRCNAIECR